MSESDYVVTRQKVSLKKLAEAAESGAARPAPKQMALESPDERGWDLVSAQFEPGAGKDLLVIWKLRQ